MRNLRLEGSKFCDSPNSYRTLLGGVGGHSFQCHQCLDPGSQAIVPSHFTTTLIVLLLEPLDNRFLRGKDWHPEAVDRTHLLIPSDPTTFGRLDTGHLHQKHPRFEHVLLRCPIAAVFFGIFGIGTPLHSSFYGEASTSFAAPAALARGSTSLCQNSMAQDCW